MDRRCHRRAGWICWLFLLTAVAARAQTLPPFVVTLEPEQAVVNGSKLKGQKALSDARGEFAFRVAPLEGAKYRVTASVPGMKSETKVAETRGGEERIDVTFMLLPASK